VSFDVAIGRKAQAFINSLPEKDRQIVINTLDRLADSPYPGKGGDKEKLVLPGGIIAYRIHVSRRYTAFYTSDKEAKLVQIHFVMTIEQAHKKYGR
jgi:mRNA-degrading endonuclease RelE of RelBE toxin-antitoxin system